jgi:hypothetical protein
VLVEGFEGHVPKLYAVDIDGTDKHALEGDESIVGPRWSPDGMRWLQPGRPEGVERLPRKLFVADREGENTGIVASVGKGSYVVDGAWQPAA